MRYVVVATFDNTDPVVFGPFETREAANAAHAGITTHLRHDEHLESLVTREVQTLAAWAWR